MSAERGPEDLLVSGMFRSGTTLVSRILGAHPRCLLVADPFVYVFKAYRNALLAERGARGWRPDEPTSDLFHDGRHALWRELLEERALAEPVPGDVLAWLRAEIRRWKAAQHPRLCARLDEVGGASFAELYRDLIELCVELYRPGAPLAWAGTKVSWSEEFLPALARAFPAMRFILVVRDPRAVCASQNQRRGVGAGKRPLFFYARHWRKSVALTLRHLADPLFAGRAVLVRYEDLVGDPAAAVEELCALADLEPDAAMLAAEGFRGVAEEGSWIPNSSFTPGAGVYRDSLERWRTALRPEEIATLEALTAPELAALGYPLDRPPLRPLECLPLDAEPRPDELAPWLRSFPCTAYLEDPALRAAELAREERRLELLEGAPPADDEELARAFPDPRVLAALRRPARREARRPAKA